MVKTMRNEDTISKQLKEETRFRRTMIITLFLSLSVILFCAFMETASLSMMGRFPNEGWLIANLFVWIPIFFFSGILLGIITIIYWLRPSKPAIRVFFIFLFVVITAIICGWIPLLCILIQ